MRITSIDICMSDDSEPITLSILDGDPNAQYITRNVVGLDAEEIVPKFYAFGLQAHTKFYEFILPSREVVARVSLNPRIPLDETFSDVRDAIYKAISVNRSGEVQLCFKDGPGVVAKLDGLITKIEASHFTATPEVQLTFSCDDPIFRSMTPVVLGPTDLSPTDPVQVADSISTAPHGFTMVMKCTSPEDYFNVQDDGAGPDWFFKVEPDGGFLVDDELHIKSDYGDRQCYLVRDGDVSFLADKVWPSSNWPLLFPGPNSFYFTNIASWDWISLEFLPAYWGV